MLLLLILSRKVKHEIELTEFVTILSLYVLSNNIYVSCEFPGIFQVSDIFFTLKSHENHNQLFIEGVL